MTKDELAKLLNIKSGYLTSEMWVTVLAQVVAVAVVLGLLAPSDAEDVESTVGAVITSGFVLFGDLLVLWKYIDSRTKVKVEQNKAVNTAILLEGSTMIEAGTYDVE